MYIARLEENVLFLLRQEKYQKKPTSEGAFYKDAPSDVPPLRNRTRERCSKKLRYDQCFGENALPYTSSVTAFAVPPSPGGKARALPRQYNRTTNFNLSNFIRRVKETTGRARPEDVIRPAQCVTRCPWGHPHKLQKPLLRKQLTDSYAKLNLSKKRKGCVLQHTLFA